MIQTPEKRRKIFTLQCLLPGLLLCVLALGGCATAPTHSVLQSSDLPELIPVRDFVANTDSNFNYQVSPDGKNVAWIGVDGTRLTIFFKALDSDIVQTIDTHFAQPIFHFLWAQDSKTLLIHQDSDGDENYHVYSVSIDKPAAAPVDLTPVKESRATIVKILRNDPLHIFIQHNQRDKTVFDLFRLNLQTRELEEIARNPGDVQSWVVDKTGRLRGRYRKISDLVSSFELLSPASKTWEKIAQWQFDETFYVVSFSDNPQSAWVMSNLDQDTTALLKLNLEDGTTEHVYSEDDIDLDMAYISKVTDTPLFTLSMPGYPQAHFFNSADKAEFTRLQQQYKGFLRLDSSDNAERVIIVTVASDKESSHYLYQRDSGKMTLLGRDPLSRYADILGSSKPISFTSRDGLHLHGYLTIPKGLEGKAVPMVLLVHGGPWARDRYGLNEPVQFLANRGYGVLQINFRGSKGYGKQFMAAGKGEFGRKMHTDLIDAVNWAIDKGVADPDKIAIFGGSYGGYATLVGMTFTPDVFACGVDIVGPSNLVSLLKTTPAYWKNFMPFFYEYVGNPDVAEDRKDMESRSPLFKVDAVTNPLLIVQGANDPRVKQAEADQMVKALRGSGKEVDYILFTDEGHGIRKWTNNLEFFRRMEDFLAKHLGGRSAGFDYYQLATPFF